MAFTKSILFSNRAKENKKRERLTKAPPSAIITNRRQNQPRLEPSVIVPHPISTPIKVDPPVIRVIDRERLMERLKPGNRKEECKNKPKNESLDIEKENPEKECQDEGKFGTFTDPRDGHTYKTVKIGNQIWMAENLAYAGVEHFSVVGVSEYDEKFGYLYTWEDAKKAVPPGWRLPTFKDFKELITENKNNSSLKDSSWSKGSNSFGFSALPAGYRDNYGRFYNFDTYAYFWSSTPNGSDNAFYLHVKSYDADVVDYYSRYHAFSVRCLQDSN